MSRILHIGAGASRRLPRTLQQLGCATPLFVVDPGLGSQGVLRWVRMQPLCFDGVVPEPTTRSLEGGVAMATHHGCDVVVGIGGGSAIDTAKLIALMAGHREREARDFRVPSQLPMERALKIVAIPTTAGSGSENTRVAVISDSITHEKMLLAGDALLPRAALVDYELTLSKPFALTAHCGLDALCPALESYVSRRATDETRPVSLQACEGIGAHLRRACHAPDDRVAREAMMRASSMAGYAFSKASVTLIHGMSRPIGARFGVPHGLSNAMLLPQVTAFSLSGTVHRYARVSRAMGFATAEEVDLAACHGLIQGLRRLCRDLEIPTLREYGVDEEAFREAIPAMVQQALDSGSPAHNPVVPSAEAMADLYLRVYEGDGPKRA